MRWVTGKPPFSFTVDAHFRPEADAARALELDVGLIDHDAVGAGDFDAGLRGVSETDAPTVYRGWMIHPARYEEMEAALARRGRHLRTTAEAFRTAHHLPRWFDQLRHVTPASVWTSSPDVEEFETALAEMPEGPAVIKDYCKSEKDYWHEAMFIPDGPPALTPPPSPRPGTTYPLRRGGGNRF